MVKSELFHQVKVVFVENNFFLMKFSVFSASNILILNSFTLTQSIFKRIELEYIRDFPTPRLGSSDDEEENSGVGEPWLDETMFY